METEVLFQLENLFQVMDESIFIQEIKIKKQAVYENLDLMKQIEKIRSLSVHDPSYLELKLKIYQNLDYQKYIELEQNLNYLLLEWNQKIKKLTGDMK